MNNCVNFDLQQAVRLMDEVAQSKGYKSFSDPKITNWDRERIARQVGQWQTMEPYYGRTYQTAINEWRKENARAEAIGAAAFAVIAGAACAYGSYQEYKEKEAKAREEAAKKKHW